MCGKFTRMASWSQVVDFSQPLSRERMEDSGNDKVVGLRVGEPIPVIVYDADLPERVEMPMQWGFPTKAGRGLDPIHCPSETIDSRPTFAPLFVGGQRGLVVVRTFNEGEEVGKKTIQYEVDPKDDAPLAFPVLWQKFTNGDQDLFACVQVTVPANQLISAITDRMPAFLAQEDWPKWLGEAAATPAELKAMLRTVEGVRWTMTKQERRAQAKKAKIKPVVSDPTPGLF
jgi:putative SOS response-associated peptidase YedK